MSENENINFQSSIRTVLTAVGTAVLLWVGTTVQHATNEMAALKTEVSYIKLTLQESTKYNAQVIENNQDIKTILKRLDKIEDSK